MGLSPYEKKRYKESKRRRRQALIEGETGYIIPYKKSKRPLVFILLLAAVCAAAAGLIIQFTAAAPKPNEEHTVVLSDEEKLEVVNRMNRLEESDVPELSEVSGIPVNAAIAAELMAMLDAAEEQGIALSVKQGYVSYTEQNKRYEENLALYTANPDYTPVRAQAAAQSVVPEAGCSESQTGLLIEFDVTDSRAKAFTERECIRYGLILRYPEDKQDVTHMQSSDSLYRYVGKENAEKMRAFGMCLEEYSQYISEQQ